jgi:hypothetical protein
MSVARDAWTQTRPRKGQWSGFGEIAAPEKRAPESKLQANWGRLPT